MSLQTSACLLLHPWVTRESPVPHCDCGSRQNPKFWHARPYHLSQNTYTSTNCQGDCKHPAKKNLRCKRSFKMISYVSQRSGDNCLKLTISGHCPFKLQLLLPRRTRGSHSPERTDWSPGLQMRTLGKAHLGLGWCLSPAACGSRETRLNTWPSLAGTTMTLRHLWVQLPWAPAFSKIICKLPLHGLILESQRL